MENHISTVEKKILLLIANLTIFLLKQYSNHTKQVRNQSHLQTIYILSGCRKKFIVSDFSLYLYPDNHFKY